MSRLNNWKQASSLMIACKPTTNVPPFLPHTHNSTNNPTLNSNAKEDYQILMMKRHSKSPFMPSKMVFPGGTLSPADHHADWKGLFERLAAPAYDHLVKKLTTAGKGYPLMEANRHLPLTPELVFRICAIRETFEETGLLLVVGADELCGGQAEYNTVNEDTGRQDGIREKSQERAKEESMLVRGSENDFHVESQKGRGGLFCGVSDEVQKEAEKWRGRVKADAEEFVKMCASMQVLPNVWSLYEWSDWLTPMLKDKSPRFDTLFYLCCLRCPQHPRLEPDYYESTKLEWSEPTSYMSQSPPEGFTKSSFAPPQTYELDNLKNFSTVHSLLHQACHRASPNWTRTRLHPAFRVIEQGALLVLPGDHLYEEMMLEEDVFEIKGSSPQCFETSPGAMHRLLYCAEHPNGRLIKSF